MRVSDNCLYLAGLCISFVMVIFANAHFASAEIYQYTDKQGVIHFTDNLQNVPASLRSKSLREGPSSLSSQDKKIVEELMKRGAIEHDLQFSNTKEMKDGVTYLREATRKELVDPEELNKPLDPRLSTPEGTISVYREALRAGNMLELKACVTNRYWEKMAEVFTAMGKQKMTEIAKDIFTHADIKKIRQYDSYADFELLVPEGDKKMSYPVSVENVFGNWKISDF